MASAKLIVNDSDANIEWEMKVPVENTQSNVIEAEVSHLTQLLVVKYEIRTSTNEQQDTTFKEVSEVQTSHDHNFTRDRVITCQVFLNLDPD
jgi:hypothetical protein